MNAIVISFVVVASLAFVNADLTDEQKAKIVANGKLCVGETGVDTELIKQARNGKFVDDEKLKSFTFCMSKKHGFQNDAGEIQTEVVREKMTQVLGDADVVNKLIETCLVPKESNEATAFETFKCYYENTPTHVSIL
ncbi:unnamed protein product [Ceutorhynchus assimilis]|uniref:Uncharacterized protein n=1 Tax=Ceutorhynchus assimilis TaxID=467358 RepID=A0A9N9MGP7_9CUCU|nr:unnamed protein product [Ceutorhynchus assimilis]